MKEEFIRTDTFVVRKHKLRIYRVSEPDAGTLLWTSQQQAMHYVQRLHTQKSLIERKGQL